MVVRTLSGDRAVEKPLVALDARRTRAMSVGMKAYAAELAARLPRVAPDIAFTTYERGEVFSAREQAGLPLRMLRERPRLVHFLSQYAPVIVPARYVVTIHDLIHLRFPEFFKARVGPYYRLVVRRLCRGAARIITDDERTVDDLVRFLDVDAAKVRVVALGAADTFFTPAPAHRAPRPYFMYAGNHREHKDLETFAKAWAALPAAIEADMYVTGSDDLDALRAVYRRDRGRIVALGEVTGEQLAAYYAGAAALVHPALCEGFGLPMLEAMLQKCPVIACSGAVPAVLAPGALRFAPRDAAAASEWMQVVLDDAQRRAAVTSAAYALAQPLSWDRCARETAQVYREVLAD